MKLGRFPKMAMLQYLRAKYLGFDEETAKAIGIAQAKKYAIFKNKTGSRKYHNTNNQKSNININTNDIVINKFFRITFDTKKGLPVLSNKIISSKDFIHYFNTYNKDIYDKLYNWAENIIKNTEKKDLEVETRFFNNVWKLYRDEEIL